MILIKMDNNKSVRVVNPKNEYVSEYSMSVRLKKNLDEVIIPALQKKDKDYVVTIDGKEGSGKSTLAFQIGKYVDPSLDLSRIVFTADEFRAAIFKAKKCQCIIYDEAFTGFSSRSSLSSINRVLVSLMMQMRQKNLFVIIVLPTIFLLDKYVALFRARVLIHVYESSGRRGYFRVYNSRLKKYLYLTGQKTYSYNSKLVRTNFRGRFYGKFVLGDKKIEEKYRKKKGKALMDTEKNPLTAGQVKYKEQRDVMLYLLRKKTNLSLQELEEMLLDFEIDISFQQIGKICAKFGDIKEIVEEKKKKIQERKEKLIKRDEKHKKGSETEENDGK